jgi:oligosaccharide reducing-end xylanase
MNTKLFISALLLTSMNLQAQTARKFTLNITDDGKAQMVCFLPEKPSGKAIVGVPGGGYSMLSNTHEGYLASKWLNKQGIAYFVVNYRLPAGNRNLPVSDVRKGIRTVRDSAGVWGINPRLVGIMGFSAGGHLASVVSTLSDYDVRPDFSILFYPVISMDERVSHKWSCINFLGQEGHKDSALVRKYSTQNAVRHNVTPPAIIITATDDNLVPPTTNALAYYTAMCNAGNECAMYCYPKGGHGFGFGTWFKYHDQMLTDLGNWLNERTETKPVSLTPETKGGFFTDKYRNVFVEMGYKPAQVEKKLKQVFNDVFRGPNKVYFEVGDSMAYISDIKNHDVRTEGMSYGMMIAVQMNEKDIFDRLWRWTKKYMQHQSGSRQGYFAWSCKTDGTHNAEGAASDGELYFITSLIFAANRWGNDTGIDYKAEALNILDCVQPRTATIKMPAVMGGNRPGGGTRTSTSYLIDPATQLITFTPDGFGQRYTDPSYHIPAFYEVWALYADDGRSAYWLDCAKKSREFLHKAINEKTGLNADMCQYDGSEMQSPRFPGMQQRPEGAPRRNGSNNFRYDSWRVPMNIALDFEWSCSDETWQRQYGETIQNFFYSQGIKKYVDQYRTDGTLPEGDEILQAGGFRKLRHSIGLTGTLAAASVMCSHKKSKEFVDELWNAKHKPFDDGYFDAYYDGLLRLFAFMHLSGHYRVIFPAN